MKIKNYINDFLLYVQFFTRIPVNKELECSDENFIRGSSFFPIIALIIGGIQYLVYLFCNKFLPPSITSIFVVLTAVLLTGALHMDGLGDVCDGFFAFKGGKEKIIEIMKDSRIGAYCCIAIVIDILFKYQLIKLAIESFTPEMIIIAPVMGRLAVVLISTIGKPAKETGSGNLFIGRISWQKLIVTSVIAILIQAIFITPKAIIINMITVLVVTYLFNMFCNSKINGLTGDTLGAINEIVEILILTIFFAI